MAHPYHHAQSSARRYGGVAEDYIALHSWFDASKAFLATPQHRALRHHTAGIFEAETVFGTVISNSAGRNVPVRFIGEQHVREDCRSIPSVSDWLRNIPLETWMANGCLRDPEPLSTESFTDGDLREAWLAAANRGETVLGLEDWVQDRRLMAEAS